MNNNMKELIEQNAKEIGELRAEVMALKSKNEAYRRAIWAAKHRLLESDKWLREGKVIEDSVIGRAAEAYRLLAFATRKSNEGRKNNQMESGKKWNFEFENEIWEDLGALLGPGETFDAVKEVVHAKLMRMEAITEESVLVYKERLRETAQILIDGVGADGPMNAEEAARKAVARIRYLDEAIVKVRYILDDAAYDILKNTYEAKPRTEVNDELKKAACDFLASVPFGPGYKMGGGDGQG